MMPLINYYIYNITLILLLYDTSNGGIYVWYKQWMMEQLKDRHEQEQVCQDEGIIFYDICNIIML
jgi:hypothetical protein